MKTEKKTNKNKKQQKKQKKHTKQNKTKDKWERKSGGKDLPSQPYPFFRMIFHM